VAVDSTLSYGQLFAEACRTGALKLVLVISGQGPEAFGMPEMFTPMQHVNANRVLRRLTTILSDGRYSGVSYGAAVGHVTPEAARGGALLSLQTGDLLHVRFRDRRIDLLDPTAFATGRLVPDTAQLAERRQLAAERLARIQARQRYVAATNRMVGHTDAAQGVVPEVIALEAVERWRA
jgi:dihydroxyacid dehydratase/phosphogluconate dehydratase